MENHVSYNIQRGVTAQKKVFREKASANLKSRDPQFDDGNFVMRVKKAFMLIQDGWCSQELGKVEAFLSDGVFERFSLQIEAQKSQGYRDKMENISIHDCRIAQLESDKHFDTIHVYVKASAVDNRVDLKSGKRLSGSGSPQIFVEYWSFLRKPDAKTLKKPGLIEGFCPNCGAPIEMGQVSRCKMCGSFLRSGEYDWVLSEITQACEWSVQESDYIPGIAEIQKVDPGFNIQHIEDKTSVIFWRRTLADRLGKLAPVRKMAMESYCEVLEKTFAPDAQGIRTFFDDCAVGSSTILAISLADEFDRVYVEVRWSGTPTTIDKTGKQTAAASVPLNHHSVFVLCRKHGVKTDIRSSLVSSHCPNCGAPESSVESAACEYCETVLNDGSKDWVLEKLVSRGDPEVRTAMKSNLPPVPGTSQNLSPFASSGASGAVLRPAASAEAISWMIQVMLADGIIDEKEMAMLKEFGQSYSIPESKLQGMVSSVRSAEVSLPLPESREEKLSLMNVLISMALADGRLAPEEVEMLNDVGGKMKFTKYDINLLIKKEKNRMYTEAKKVIKESKKFPPPPPPIPT